MWGGRSLRTTLVSLLDSGRWCFPLTSQTLWSTDFCWIRFFGSHLSIITLLGLSQLVLLVFSYSSRAAFSLRFPRGSTLACIWQAAVGVDLIPPLIKRRALFCILSKLVWFALLQVVINAAPYSSAERT